MKRFPLNRVLQIYDAGVPHFPMHLGKHYVTPGEKFGCSCTGQVESVIIASNNVPLKIETLWFYVPNRLVWTGWTDFISDPDTALSIPTDSVGGFPAMGEGSASVTRNALGRRAFKLAFNKYLGDENFPTGWYTDITTDSDITVKQVKTLNGLHLSMQLAADDMPADLYTVDVTGPPAQIDMLKFARSTDVAHRAARERNYGTTYADALRRFGVSPPAEMISDPQLLNITSEVVYPMVIDQTGGAVADIGKRYGKYRFAVKTGFADRFFMEHGFVFGVLICRPITPTHVAARQNVGYPADQLTSRGEFFMTDADPLYERVNYFSLGETVRPKGALFSKGDIVALLNSPALQPSTTPTTFDTMIYPVFATMTMTSGLQTVFKGYTPWPDRVYIDEP